MKEGKKNQGQPISLRPEHERYRMDLGRRLRSVREEFAGGESPAKFAQRFGRSKSTVARYEEGSRDADAWFLCQLSRTLDLEPAWLLSGIGEPVSANTKRMPPKVMKSMSPLTQVPYQEVLDDIALVVREVEEIIEEQGVLLTASAKGNLMALVFDYLLTRSEDVVEPVRTQITRLVRFGT